MSSDEQSGIEDTAPATPKPGVPDIEDPRPSTPLTEDFVTGTANDPDLGADGDGMNHVTVDGHPIAVPPGSTLIDAIDA
ncbi:hypothetical protein, partial [Haladaptatus sp. W1]|uniref:hypothetical protein n=1 Tax=Haladaptatus sp. W1 TaxID=1897478 RepID=UPI001112ED75